jgi:hypothetical protein
MTKPISNDNFRSDPSLFYADPDACNADVQSCQRPANPSTAPREVTLEPVYVTGEAGAQKLVDQYCETEKSAAIDACLKAGAVAVCAVPTAAYPPVFAAALLEVYLEGKACGKELALLHDCETEAR